MGEALYFNGSSAKTLDDGAKVDIMNELEEGEVGFGELVERLGLAKSTISKHLADLESMDLVSVSPDEDDARRKVVSIESEKVGSVGEKVDMEESLRQRLASSMDSPEDFLKANVLVLRYYAYTEGLDLDPGMKQAGHLIGSEVGKKLDATDVETLLEELSERWEEQGMGKLGSDFPYIAFKNGFGCETIPGPGVCGFYEGFFEGVLATGLGESQDVVMRSCEASGASYCRFEMTSV